MVALSLEVRDVRPATPRTRVIRLDLGGHSFDYQAGQAVLVSAKNGKPSAYSLTAPPEEARLTGCLEILSRIGPCDSDLICSASDVVQVTGPVGRFTLPSEAGGGRRLVFIAGGTGIAPVRAMLRRAVTLPDCDIDLLYSARAPDEFPYESELQALARTGRIRLWQTVTRETNSNGWSGGFGRIGEPVLKPFAADPATLFLICGPLTLLDCTQDLLARFGVPSDRIRTDRW